MGALGLEARAAAEEPYGIAGYGTAAHYTKRFENIRAPDLLH